MNEETLKSYTIGFILSLVLTLVAYDVVVDHFFSGWGLVFVILALAMAQLVIQLVFFLHLASEFGGRWKLAIFLSTVSLVLIIVIGSLWIMNHLNYNMTPAQMNQYMQDQQGGF